jgi:DNA-binding MarR family transcriptional regulator
MKEYESLIEKFMIVNKARVRIIKEIENYLEDINFTDYIILKKVYCENRDLSMTELSELIGFSNTLITFAVDNLEKKGYVYRQKGEDRRTYYIKITEKGKKSYKDLEKIVREEMNKIFEKIDEKDLERLTVLMSEVNNIMNKYIKKNFIFCLNSNFTLKKDYIV